MHQGHLPFGSLLPYARRTGMIRPSTRAMRLPTFLGRLWSGRWGLWSGGASLAIGSAIVDPCRIVLTNGLLFDFVGIGAARPRPLALRLLFHTNRTGRAIHLDRNARQRRISRPHEDSCGLGRIERCPMTGTHQMLSALIISNRATRMCAKCIKCNIPPIAQVHQNAIIAIGGKHKRNGTIERNLAGASNDH